MKKDELLFRLGMQLFAEEGNQGDGGSQEEGAPQKDDKKDDEPKDDKIILTPSQLQERLQRAEKKAKEEAQNNLSTEVAKAVALAIEEQEKKKQEKKTFESLTEDEKRERLWKQREEEISKREEALLEQTNQIKVSQKVEVIMNSYDADKLPRRDKFKSIAKLLANSNISEEEQANIYNDFKDIIEDVKKSAFKESLKQNPPQFSSTRFAKMQNDKNSKKGTSSSWRNKNY
jgi:hypothetical protein